MTAVLAAPVTLLDRVLRPYKPHCKYLLSAAVDRDSEGLTGRGEFAIPESCYIDDTGHLNAVEVNISYNQLMYYTVARAVESGLEPVLAGWTMDDYWAHQLPDILIARFTSTFRRPIDARRFAGEFRIVRAQRRAGLIRLDTRFRYWDDVGGRCDGEARIAITNP